VEDYEVEIIINNRKYKPGKSKAKMWRELMKFDEQKTDIPLEDFIDAHAEMIVKTFANPDITPELILENLDMDEILPLYTTVFKWFCSQLNAKAAKLPNDEPAMK
jgi:hypothetical protein